MKKALLRWTMGEQPVSVFPHRITKGAVRSAETFQIRERRQEE